MHVACRECFPCHMIKCLLKNGADADARDKLGRTPLMHALLFGYSAEKMMNFMLRYSDAANSVNSSGNDVLKLIDNQHETVWSAFLDHLALLQVLGLPMHEKVLETVSADPVYGNSLSACVRELERAKDTKLKNSWVTYLDLLVHSGTKMKNYAGNEDLVRDFEEDKFPIYGERMGNNVRKGVRRRAVFDESSVLLSECLPIFNASHLIVKDVLDCVPTRDLFKLCNRPLAEKTITTYVRNT